MAWLRISSKSSPGRDLFKLRSMQCRQLALHPWPDPEGTFDNTHFSPDAGPVPFDLDAGFVHAPGSRKAVRATVPAQAPFDFRRAGLHPAMDGGAVRRDAARFQHFLGVTLADAMSAAPPDGPRNDLARKCRHLKSWESLQRHSLSEALEQWFTTSLIS